jgi:membrane-bound metal-dependent hydrolase YbcI (DUF457 family)
MLIGVGAGLGVSFLMSKIMDEKIGIKEITSATIGGILGSFVPDKIDFPKNPNHRSIGHGALPVGFTIYKSLNIMNRRELPLWLRYAIYGFIAGYVLHLLADFTTPKCIPVLA